MDPTALSATDLAAAVRGGQIKPSEVMAAYLDRIEERNPAINAIIALRPRDELIAEARALDGMEPSGPLFGLPMAVKDLVATKGIRTTWGSPIHAEYIPDSDDLLARRLPGYRKADHTVVTDGLTVREVADRVAEWLKKTERR